MKTPIEYGSKSSSGSGPRYMRTSVMRSSVGLLDVSEIDDKGPRTSTGGGRRSVIQGVLSNRNRMSGMLQAGASCARLSAAKLGGGNLVADGSELADQMSANQLPSRYHGIARKLFSKLNHSDLVDLYDYMDGQPFVVRPQMGVFRVHKLFTLLGLRHVPVIDYGEKCVGIITRKDLLPHVLESFTARAAETMDTTMGAQCGMPPEAEEQETGHEVGEEGEGEHVRDFSYRCSVGEPNPIGEIRV